MPLQYFFPKDISLQANHLKGRWMVKGRHSKRKGNFHIILRNASLLQRQKLDKSRSTGSLLESRRQPCVLLSFAKLLLLCIVFSPKLNYTKKKDQDSWASSILWNCNYSYNLSFTWLKKCCCSKFHSISWLFTLNKYDPLFFSQPECSRNASKTTPYFSSPALEDFQWTLLSLFFMHSVSQ